jgi:osmoprotectant transport system substrate-binding protein
MRRLAFIAVGTALFGALLAVSLPREAAAPVSPEKPSRPAPTITVGAKSLTEQYLLMKMTSIVLRWHGYDVNEMVFLDSPAVRSAMEAGVVDLYWEYTSTARLYYHKQKPIYDPDAAWKAVAEEDKQKGIGWFPRSEFNSSWAVMVREDLAKKWGISSISDLVEYVRTRNPRLKLATNEEFLHREDGMQRLRDLYDLSLPDGQVMAVDSGLLPQAVKESRVDAAVGMASDPRIKEAHLIVLEDDKHAFPPYHASPVVLGETLKKYPELQTLIEPIRIRITQENMLDLMYQVDILHKDVTKTAYEFLVGQRIIQPLN